MYTPEHHTRVSGSALLPFAVFIVIYLGAGLIQQARGVQMAFYQFPSVTAMFFAVITAGLAFDPLKVLPYLAVLLMALLGMNVFLVLTCGIFLSGIIGMLTGSIDLFIFAQNIWKGFTSMDEVFFLTLFCAGMSELVMHNGGLAWLVQKLQTMMKGARSAQLGIAALVNACYGTGEVTSLDLIPYVWYCWLPLLFGLLSILFPFADGVIRKDPWKWE